LQLILYLEVATLCLWLTDDASLTFTVH